MTDLRAIARALGGEVHGHQVLAPGPHRPPTDRSLRVWLSPNSPDGFLAQSSRGDSFHACREHIRAHLDQQRELPGLGPFDDVHDARR